MATIRPFPALRPIPEKAADVAALPYDVYNREEAVKVAYGDYDTFLRVDRPEITMDPRIDIHDPAVYRQAVRNLNRLIDRDIMIQDDMPCLYLYELVMEGRSQIGLVCCVSIDEYMDNTIKKHEKTRSDKEVDRTQHVDALNANTGPIFLTYRHLKEIDTVINRLKSDPPEVDFTSEDDITHRVWVIEKEKDIAALVSAFEKVPELYIADGHHRSASAVHVGQMRREEHPDYTGEEEFNYFLAVAFPDNQLQILDYNRVVKDLNGLSPETFLDKVKENFDVRKIARGIYRPKDKAEFGMYLDGYWYQLKAKEGSYPAEDPLESLDVAILQNNLLQPILGIEDPRTDCRIDFVGGIRGLEELERRVSEDMRVAFAMYPTEISELMAIADADALMPPKSTWFEPKLRSGLFIHYLE
ncbi:MAG: DUF1015 domain-containing protein [Eubacteriaceae bacterium]|jgi:uncharacterized protein (DUF1015 family)|nr:DUF1015 domain-containing protein [Eubacteriaceae bacterium]